MISFTCLILFLKFSSQVAAGGKFVVVSIKQLGSLKAWLRLTGSSKNIQCII
jgi:hypothetical protein